MKAAIEELLKKYMENPPEVMTSKDIRHLSENELLDMDFFVRAFLQAVFTINILPSTTLFFLLARCTFLLSVRCDLLSDTDSRIYLRKL